MFSHNNHHNIQIVRGYIFTWQQIDVHKEKFLTAWDYWPNRSSHYLWSNLSNNVQASVLYSEYTAEDITQAFQQRFSLWRACCISCIIQSNVLILYIFMQTLCDLQCIQVIHCFISMCVPWELNPRPIALLTQCSTTEPQEHMNVSWLHCVCCESVRRWRSCGIFLRRSRAHRVPETRSPGTSPNTSGSSAPNPPPERCWTRLRGPSSASQVCAHVWWR